MKVEITETDIRLGKRLWHTECPVAIALSRARNKPSGAGEGFLFDCPSPYVSNAIGDTPAQVRAFIAAFDNGKEVKPFEFEFYERTTKAEPNS